VLLAEILEGEKTTLIAIRHELLPCWMAVSIPLRQQGKEFMLLLGVDFRLF
jgi:hypothetical protein